MAHENTISNQQEFQIVLSVSTGKKATYRTVKNFIKPGPPCQYNPWTL
ncbi:MAG: hypothetical protein H6Q00_1827 [Holophagaceae bacterium]|nr:hypothetical protein [Holophagaceae bacterium]